MVLVIGLWTLLRALVGGSMAVALENVALRHQLAVLQRSGRRPKLQRWDRVFWVGRSLKVERRAKAKAPVKSGYGDRGDRAA